VESGNVSLKRSIFGIVLAGLALVAVINLVPSDVSFVGRASLGMMAALVILVMSAALPLVAVSILLMLGTYFLGILDYDDVWKAFGNYIIFFVIAMFGLCAAINKTTLPQRLAGVIARFAGTDSRKVVFGFVLATALVSSMMSNITACAIFMGLALGLLKANGSANPGKSALGRCLFIGVPAASVLGGISAFPGNSMNVLSASIMQQQVGVEINFLQWMIVGYPVAIIMSLLVAWWLCVLFKPEPLTQEASLELRATAERLGPLTFLEKKVIVIAILMIVFWIASTWISWLNTNIVALLGLIVMLTPGVSVLEQKELTDAVPLDIILFLGCSMAFMSGFMATDATEWLIGIAFSGADSWPHIVSLIAIAAIPIVIRTFVQSGAVVIMLVMPPLIGIASVCGVDPMVVAFIAAFVGGVQFLLPIDGIYIMTFGYKYYTALDLLKFGWLPTLAMLIVSVTLVPALVNVALLL
jgi:solute carrier family 13 (sodium-dependent dicarboxylate transporter), member 2/3/5